MSINKKRVILLIVEGNCEESLLFDRLRTIFSKHEIRFHVEHGDILHDINRKNSSIKSVIGNTVKAFILKNKFKASDILAVIHIIDTDGCFISDDEIVINEAQERLTLYQEDMISVTNEKQKELIIKRNMERSRNINIMRTSTTILPSKINYRMYFFSRNLEHVLFNEPNPSTESKVTDVEEFIETLSIPIEDFLRKHMPMIVSTEEQEHELQYLQSWEHITKKLLLWKELVIYVYYSTIST